MVFIVVTMDTGIGWSDRILDELQCIAGYEVISCTGIKETEYSGGLFRPI